MEQVFSQERGVGRRFEGAFRRGSACFLALLFWNTSHAFSEQIPRPAAEQRIWAALIVASHVEHPYPPPPDFGVISKKVNRFFGCNQIELIGTASKILDVNAERWLVPSQDFWLSVKSKRDSEGATVISLQLFQDQRRILVADVKLALHSPILIRGPVHERGQVLVVLELR